MIPTTITPNVLGLCEVAENRSGKFRFRRHVAKANFYLLNYEKKPIKLAFSDYEAKNFQLSLNPPFCKTLVIGRHTYLFMISTAFSRTSSLPFLIPSIVGFTIMSGTIPTRCVSVPSG